MTLTVYLFPRCGTDGKPDPSLNMTETSSPSRFKAEMPQIPGVNTPGSRPTRRPPFLFLLVGLLSVGAVLFITLHWISRPRPAEPVRVQPPPQIDVPTPRPDPASLLPHASEANPVIAQLSELAKPWSAADFFIRDKLTGENIPAMIIRLPGGSAATAGAYWAFSRKAPYDSCQLEYVTDLEKLRQDYGYRAPSHPLVGNPCSRTLFDPLKTASLPGNIWIRGAVVQGSDLRPPYGVEIKVQGKQILALRTE